MRYAIEVLPPATLPVDGTDELFPIRHVYGVGRNYSDHPEREDKDRDNLLVFTKDPTAVIHGSAIDYPSGTRELRYEIEMVVALQSGGTNIAPERALDHVYGYGVGLDLTKKDVQERQKAKGWPWELGKSFEASGPCSVLRRAADVGHPSTAEIWLKVNGERKQFGNLRQMIWNVPAIIAELSNLFTLRAGDLIFSGTPAGMGSVGPGDLLEGHVDGLAPLRITINDN